MSTNLQTECIETYCPVCDAHEIYTELNFELKNDGSAKNYCDRCGYHRAYTKEELERFDLKENQKGA